MSGGIRMVKDFMHLPTQPVVRIAGVHTHRMLAIWPGTETNSKTGYLFYIWE